MVEWIGTGAKQNLGARKKCRWEELGWGKKKYISPQKPVWCQQKDRDGGAVSTNRCWSQSRQIQVRDGGEEDQDKELGRGRPRAQDES